EHDLQVERQRPQRLEEDLLLAPAPDDGSERGPELRDALLERVEALDRLTPATKVSEEHILRHAEQVRSKPALHAYTLPPLAAGKERLLDQVRRIVPHLVAKEATQPVEVSSHEQLAGVAIALAPSLEQAGIALVHPRSVGRASGGVDWGAPHESST